MYKLYESRTIIDNYEEFLEHCSIAKDLIVDKVGEETTWTYSQYNTFNITSSSHLFYDLFKELNYVIRDYIQNDSTRIWMQSWMNFHTEDKVLNWHGHDWPFHGYICVDPKKSKTIFTDWEIENKVGQIYIGPGTIDGKNQHKVEVLEPYEGERITIGFDCSLDASVLRDNLIPIL